MFCCLLLGDITNRGEEVFERSGHFTPTRKPYLEFDTKKIFLSPTIKYSGGPAYAKIKERSDKRSLS